MKDLTSPTVSTRGRDTFPPKSDEQELVPTALTELTLGLLWFMLFINHSQGYRHSLPEIPIGFRNDDSEPINQVCS